MNEETLSPERELEGYLEEVQLELEKRERRLAMTDKELTQLEFDLQRLGSQGQMLSGNAARISELEAYRDTLRKRITEKKNERAEVQEEVRKAFERRRLAQEELMTLRGETKA